ncbi:MAG: hypothetical protein DRI90_18105 [Deltaproteobacteria bacterium]|nr:MAG: hypothetical protein DRI90_18105 [Deltaproteobacteria bacterium]
MSSMARTHHLALIAPLILTACSGESEGVSWGRFTVTAERTQSCGDGVLLGSAATMSYPVHLRRVGDEWLHWDDGSEVLVLALNLAESSFSLQRTMSFDMRFGDDNPDALPCYVQRFDELEGVLEGTEAEGFESFAGSVNYGFTPLADSSCADLLQGPEPIADTLPCTIAYDLVAERAE